VPCSLSAGSKLSPGYSESLGEHAAGISDWLVQCFNALTRNASPYSRIALPRDSGHLVREDINIERTVVPDAAFSTLFGYSIMSGQEWNRNCPCSFVVKDATSVPFSSSTTKVAFASGCELGTSALIGPAWVGPNVITPSIPDPDPDCVCPEEEHAAMTRNSTMIGNFRNVII
jgi:hypothetical protein